ncbi:MAG: hypothetical protein PHC61_17345, partial [Chitinivibrionales bacterium]|nr:hypothetical protein [Chitinivibrionales bacterium]
MINSPIETMLWIIPLAPLAGALLLGALAALSPRRGEFPGRSFVSIIACAGPMVSLLVSAGVVYALAQTPENRTLHQTLYSWITCASLSIDLAFEADRFVAL